MFKRLNVRILEDWRETMKFVQEKEMMGTWRFSHWECLVVRVLYR